MTFKSACNILNLDVSPQIQYCKTEREILKDEAVKAFRDMMMIHHPDKGGEQEKALQIIEAVKFIKKYLSEECRKPTISEWMAKSREKQKERKEHIRQWKKENNFKTNCYTQIGPLKRKGRTINQYSLTGEFIKEWASAKDAADFLKTDVSAINKCARGVKYYQTAANFVWKYPEEKVFQYSLNGQLIKEWNDAKEAGASLNKDFSAIRKCARGIQQTAHGFVWNYKKV